MSWLNRLFGRGSDDTQANTAGAGEQAARPAAAAHDVPQTPAVENDVLPTPGTGPADAELHEPVTGDRSPAVGESGDGAGSGAGTDFESQTPSAVDVDESAAASVEGVNAPARGTGADSGAMSLTAMTVPQLREQARALGLPGYSRLGKADLIELISKAR